MHRFIPVLIVMLFARIVTGQLEAYKLFDRNGKSVKFSKVINSSNRADVVLFGEIHNNPISHWLQLELVKKLCTKRDLILGAEMFEADNQSAINDFLEDRIDAQDFDSLVRLWNNYYTDYAPLVNFVKHKKIQMIATNIPRKYARLVFKGGFEALDTLATEERKWMAPLPIQYDPELSGYKSMLEIKMPVHGGENLPKAQAIKDATMAHFIHSNRWDKSLFVHLNGAYHSNNDEGIGWHLRHFNLSIQIITISTVWQKDVKKLANENKGIADFIIVVDENMTKTY